MSQNCRHPLDRLVDIMARLRAPDGCPWDLEQTHQSLARYAIEEAYEVSSAAAQGDSAHLCDELGDLLLQVVFHAQIAREQNAFSIDDVVAAICEKLIRRHPHVFGDTVANDAETVTRNWEAIKAAERGESATAPRSVLASVKGHLPALAHAQAVQALAAKVGFDWPDAQGPLDKVAEEAAEIRRAATEGSRERTAAEWGDLLFALVNLGRHLGFESEVELRRASERFMGRFRHMEQHAERPLAELDADTQDALWRKAKAVETESP